MCFIYIKLMVSFFSVSSSSSLVDLYACDYGAEIAPLDPLSRHSLLVSSLIVFRRNFRYVVVVVVISNEIKTEMNSVPRVVTCSSRQIQNADWLLIYRMSILFFSSFRRYSNVLVSFLLKFEWKLFVDGRNDDANDRY